MSDDFTDHLCEYWHNGSYWAVIIKAESREDAAVRLKQMGSTGKVLGPCSAPMPATLGPLVRFEVWLRNLFGGHQP